MSTLFQLTSQRLNWLAGRQSIIAQNIAHANTPNYSAKSSEPFESVLNAGSFKVATTHANHVQSPQQIVKTFHNEGGDEQERTHSMNSVSIEKEMIAASEVKGSFALTTAVSKAFQRMTLLSVKG